MIEQQKLLAEVEAFLAKTGMPVSMLGVNAIGNPMLVVRLRAGGTVTIDKARELREYMKAYKAPSFKPRPSRATAKVA